MNTPQPVDLNKLKSILGNAKAVMKKADELKTVVLSETTQKQAEMEASQEPIDEEVVVQAREYSDDRVKNSKLPDAVKKAMIEQRIPQPSLVNSKFSLEDMSDLEDIKMTPNRRVAPKTVPVRLNENKTTSNSDLITVSKSELNEMINAKLLDFLTKSYNKNLTEEAIKKTINMLIKEGKLTIKKK